MQTTRASLYLEAESMAQAMRILRKCVNDYRTGYAEAFLDIQRATLSAEAEAKTYDELRPPPCFRSSSTPSTA